MFFHTLVAGARVRQENLVDEEGRESGEGEKNSDHNGADEDHFFKAALLIFYAAESVLAEGGTKGCI